MKTKEIEQQFKEIKQYMSDLSRQKEKDSGNLWIQFIDKFSAFEKRLLSLSSSQLKPSDKEIEKQAEKKYPDLYNQKLNRGFRIGATQMRDNPESFLTK